jgi:tRNA threonylcarbamoyladenosine biosynthesis protein TsaB
MMNDKKILAIETSGELCSVSLSFEYDKYDERNILMKHIHSEKLIPMIDEVLSSNKTSTKELDCVAVSVGPGSFTGLRIGMTAAKGIAFASNLPIIPVPSLDALSLEICEFAPPDITFCIVNKANIEECYFAKYKNDANELVVLDVAKLINKSEIDTIIQNSDLVFGNFTAVNGIKNISSPRATSIAKWTYLYGEDLLTFDYDYLEPNYLKNFKVKQKK